jgi:hypothetical protein
VERRAPSARKGLTAPVTGDGFAAAGQPTRQPDAAALRDCAMPCGARGDAAHRS